MKRWIGWIVVCVGLVACSEEIVEEHPLDDEFGTLDYGKADNGVVRPGSDEARALLGFVNQTLATRADVDAFTVLLDSQLHRLAVENIVNFRVGADGTPGSADDQTFASLIELDSVRFVGRVAILRLFELAVQNGLLPAQVNCDDYLNRGKIDKLSVLVEIENSRCNHFTGPVTIQLSDLPPQYRDLSALDAVRTIDGPLRYGNHLHALENAALRGLEQVGAIDTENVSDQIELPALKEIGYLKVSQFSEFRQPPPSFDALEKVGTLLFHRLHENTFPSLVEADEINVKVGYDLRGFSRLSKVNKVTIDIHNGEVRGFNALEEADTIVIDGTADLNPAFRNLKRVGYFSAGGLGGGLPSLERIGTLKINTLNHGEFARLRTADSIEVKLIKEVFPFPELTRVTDTFHARGFRMQSGPSKLTFVGGNFEVTTSLSTFDNLEEIGGTLKLECFGYATPIWNGLNTLTQVADIETSTSRNCLLDGLNAVEVTGSVQIQDDQEDEITVGLQNLEFVENLVSIRRKRGTFDYLPSLQFAGELELSATSEFAGLDALEGVDGDVKVLDVARLTGLNGLTTVGGDITFSGRLLVTYKDRLLAQLQHFSGDVIRQR